MEAETRLRALLPAEVAICCALGAEREEPLLGEESTAMAGSSPERRREFRSGRRCARRALAQLGVEPCAIPVGKQREPRWPQNVIGSITHCLSFCAAAVCRRGTYLAIGIDAETDQPLSPRVRELVTSDSGFYDAKGLERIANWGTVVFSIKESVFKAWFPSQGRWLDFSDVRVSLNPEQGSFAAYVIPAGQGPFRELHGVFSVAAGLILTAVLVQE